jgi:phytol kinase
VSPLIGIAAVLLVLGGLIGGLRVLKNRIPPEISRKGVHVGMGLVCLSFPWIFHEPWPVLVLAALAMVGLAAVRIVPLLKHSIGGVLGGVERRSLGEFYFPAAVAAVFILSEGDKLLFVIPILTLTVADTVGALIGIRYGMARYQTDEGLKSAEGSIAFFTAAFLSCHVPLLLFSQTGRAESLLIGLTAGLVVMLLEAISWRGQDNLIIPLGMFFLLRFYLPMESGALLTRLILVVALVALVLLCRKRTTLSDSAVLAAALSGYALWAFGGWFWLLPPLLLFAVYVRLPRFPGPERPMQNLHAVTRVMAGGFFWMLLSFILSEDLLAPFLICMAAHTGNIVTARLQVACENLSLGRIIVLAWLTPTVLFGILSGAGVVFGLLPSTIFVTLPLAIAASVGVFCIAWPVEESPPQRGRRWAAETLIAILASCLGLLRFP